MRDQYKYIACLFILWFFTSCNRKCDYILNYYPPVYKGLIEYEKGNPEKAYFFLKKSFKACPARNTRTLNEIDIMAFTSARLNHNKTCYKMLKKQLNNGFTLSKYTNDSIFNSFFSTKLGLKLIQRSDKIVSAYSSTIDTSIYNNILEMSCADQKYRGSVEQKSLDSINEKKLIEIFETNKYPKESLLRYKSNSFVDIHTILLHTKDSIRLNYFLPKIKEFIIEGRCDPYVYATLYDQYYLYNGLPQIYGTYKNRDRTLSKHIAIDEMNKNRLSIGLPTLEDELILHELKILNYPDTYGKFYKK